MIWHLLDRPVDVYRRVLTPDGSGGRSRVWAQQGVVWALVSQPQANQTVLADQATSRHDHIIHLAPDTDVRRGDRLRDAVAEPALVDADARPYFDVISTIKPSKSDVYLRAECVLLQPEDLP